MASRSQQLLFERSAETLAAGKKIQGCPIDLLCCGFPCQPISEAGQRRGIKDERWLWPESIKFIRAIRPRWVLLENVPGLLRSGMGEVLRDLSAERYDAVWRIIRAGCFGLSQIRKRVFLVAHASEFGREALLDVASTISKAPCEAAARAEGWRVGYFRGVSGRVWQAPISSFTGVDYGISSEVDRLAAIGNAVIPHAVEWLGRIIEEANSAPPVAAA